MNFKNTSVQTSSPEPIDLYVNNFSQILLVDDVLPLDDLITRLESYSSGIDKDADFPGVIIHAAPEVPMGFITDIKGALYRGGWEDINVSLWNYHLSEKETSRKISRKNPTQSQLNEWKKRKKVWHLDRRLQGLK